MIAAENKNFSDGEFVKKCIITAMEEINPEKVPAFQEISLSRRTVTRRIEQINDDVFNQLQNKVKNFTYFSVAMDESTDVINTAQLLIFVRGIDDAFNITEELASLESLHGRTTGEEIFKKLQSCISKLGLRWEALCGLTTDGAPNMVGGKTGLVGRLRDFVKLKRLESPVVFHCLIHLQALCSKVMDMAHVMKVVVKVVNFIRSHALNHREFRTYLQEIQSEYGDIIYYSQVRWLSRGKVLQRFHELKHEIPAFMTEKGKPVHELEGELWMWDFVFLVDISAHLNELNLRLQKRDKMIFELLNEVNAFERKLILFINQIEKENFVHFEKCLAFHEKSEEAAPVQKFLRNLKCLQTEFQTRFAEVRKHETIFRIIENPFVADEGIATRTLPNGTHRP